ncbi:3-hydroxyacyl-[acyl-carrier-protein] dehydratase [Arenibacter nanhaiticus]|uniref:3-hydroxyacyl-[acyl-carrier-protein] dehydratase n=1 Tax=Arenibacter nanhaiticus TaxID=558155 RepID=A0A1M6G6S8_9FLAO|nr:hydroxymyristoyl-ACP dehydratase [Arenibacter nanhaiticus]SHJ05668.1 3-hydroxyacyl-[acyl-carrier-protein] dehydratase [Arenibacter nanhaiticus]
MNTYKEILDLLPYKEPFLFVNDLATVNDDGATGSYTFKAEEGFYRGHFKEYPVTPGVILTECCAQIGLVCLGIYLLKQEQAEFNNPQIALSRSQMDFSLPVFPEETVTVSSSLVYFRFHKLKCLVKMHNGKGQLVCQGVLEGMLKI